MEAMIPEDYESVERAGRVLHERGWRKAFSLNEMTDAWGSLVGRVEIGYDENIYEYMNDLACRGWLALAWPMLTDQIRSMRQPELDALDARFLAATAEDAGVSRFYSVESKDGWWWRRLPIQRRGEFADDLDQ